MSAAAPVAAAAAASASSWATGLGFSMCASLIGALSKLCIRRSYTMLAVLSSPSIEEDLPPPPPPPPLASLPPSSSQHHDEENPGSAKTSKSIKHVDSRSSSMGSCVTPDTVVTEDSSSENTLSDNDDDDMIVNASNVQGNTNSTSGKKIEALSLLKGDELLLTSSSSSACLNVTTSPTFDDSTSPNRNLIYWRKLQAFALRGLGMFGMSVLGPMCNVYALQFASPSILSPVGGGLTLVWIILLSECTIGEKPRRMQIYAVGCIVLGEVIIAFSGDHVNLYSLSISDMQAQYKEPRFVMYITIMAIWVSSLIVMILYGDAGWRRFGWGVIGGSVTGMQNFIKDALAVLHWLQAGGDNEDGNEGEHFSLFRMPLPLFMLAIAAAVMPLAGLFLMMASMKRYEATYAASMFMGSLVISASIMSAVHYHTFDHLSPLEAVFYPIGLFSMLSGTAILATERSGTIPSKSHPSPPPSPPPPSRYHDRTTGELNESYGSIEMSAK